MILDYVAVSIAPTQASFVRNVADFVSVGSKVSVRIISIELEKSKFALSLLTEEEEAAQASGDKGRRSSSDAPRRASRNDANFTRGKREGEGDKATPTRGKVATRGMTLVVGSRIKNASTHMSYCAPCRVASYLTCLHLTYSDLLCACIPMLCGVPSSPTPDHGRQAPGPPRARYQRQEG